MWLLLQGRVRAGICLLLWGALAVNWIDNLVRPLVISSVAKIPFLFALFGVLGGLAAFGLIGLFVGPVILAILFALLREWSADNVHRSAGARPEWRVDSLGRLPGLRRVQSTSTKSMNPRSTFVTTSLTRIR